MKRAAIIVSIFAGIALVAYIILLNRQTMLAMERLASAQNANQPVSVTITSDSLPPVVKSIDGVIAKCRLVPNQFVDLSFNSGGIVKELLVKEGEAVSEGQTIGILSNQEQFKAAVAAADLEVLRAQQSLDDLYLQAPIAAAEALKEVADAPLDVQSAERLLSGLTKGEPSQSDIDIASANVVFAENKLKAAQDAYQPYANKPEDNLTRANFLTKLSQAQKEYDAAVRTLNGLQGTPSEYKISQAEADLELARVRYEEAVRRYEILKNGPDPEKIALVKANLDNAQAQLDSALASLNNLELRAPFSGTVVNLDLKVGQYVPPGVSVVKIVDFSDWQVETTNLTELNVVYLENGNQAVITFDALPDLQFPGTLTKISSLGENRQGDIVYTAVFNMENYDPRLKWNMTCSANIRFKN